MTPIRSDQLRGNWATLLLPIDDREAIDFAALADEIDAIIAFKVDGVYSNGTAGEFHAQSDEEFDRINALLAERCERARLPFQIGLSHTFAIGAAERLRRGKALAPSAFQIILPDWFPLTDDEAYALVSRMAELADPIGLVLYNPPHAKRVLTGDAMRKLAERVPSLLGAKVGNVDQAWFDALGEQGKRLSIFTPGHFLATHTPMGCRGAYSNVACINPGGAQRWTDTMRTNLPAAQAFQKRLLDVFAAHVTPFITERKYANAAVDKVLAAAGGWANVGTRLRWPYRWIAEEEVAPLRAIFRERLPELFDSSMPFTA